MKQTTTETSFLSRYYFPIDCPACQKEMFRTKEDGFEVVYCINAEGRCRLAEIRFEAPYQPLSLNPVVSY